MPRFLRRAAGPCGGSQPGQGIPRVGAPGAGGGSGPFAGPVPHRSPGRRSAPPGRAAGIVRDQWRAADQPLPCLGTPPCPLPCTPWVALVPCPVPVGTPMSPALSPVGSAGPLPCLGTPSCPLPCLGDTLLSPALSPWVPPCPLPCPHWSPALPGGTLVFPAVSPWTPPCPLPCPREYPRGGWGAAAFGKGRKQQKQTKKRNKNPYHPTRQRTKPSGEKRKFKRGGKNLVWRG